MIDRIQEKLFDILQADPLLVVGFDGVTRARDDEEPQAGYVNIFDWAMEDDSNQARPAIYCGKRNASPTDREEFAVVASDLVEYRVSTVPIVVVTAAPDRTTARRERADLVAAIQAILSKRENRIVSNYWWRLREAGGTGLFRNSGGGAVGGAEAQRIMNYDISYKRAAGTVYN